ncbi:hypothetical protein IJ182_02550 [bacterium]|nr:hypothetical protein [bacterium]
MKNKFYSLILTIVFSVTGAFASVFEHPAKISDISDKIPKFESINCSFKQEKKLKNIEKPLISEGNFSFVKDKGVYFETLIPIKSTVSYTNKDYKQINDIVLAISKRKYSKLDNEFEFFFINSDNIWELGLRPKKTSNTEDFINSIYITGSDYINKINIDLKNGNNTTIWFTKK